MTKDHVSQVLEKYDFELQRLGCRAVQESMPGSDDANQQLNHVMWMTTRANFFVQNNEIEKGMRWLGFIQGVLYCYHIYTIDEMREHNRSPE